MTQSQLLVQEMSKDDSEAWYESLLDISTNSERFFIVWICLSPIHVLSGGRRSEPLSLPLLNLHYDEHLGPHHHFKPL
jgi:hypothetical protein